MPAKPSISNFVDIHFIGGQGRGRLSLDRRTTHLRRMPRESRNGEDKPLSAKASNPKEARLLELSLFKSADQKALGHLASAADEVSVKAGQILIRQGHNHNEVYVIESGTASVAIEGKEVAEIPAGEFVGELGFFVAGPATATVTAKTDLEVLIIPYNRFDQILNDNPGLVMAILREIAERLHDTDAKLL